MKTDGATKTLLKLCTAATIAAAATTTSFADPPAPPVPPALITEVKAEDFLVSVSLPAVFETTKLTPISVEPKAWKDLTITHVIPHGTTVKKGTRLIQLDLKALEEQIENLEAASQTAKLTLQATTESLTSLETTTPLSIAAAKRAKQQADQDLDYWINQSRAREIQGYKRNVESSQRQLEYAQEELNQLQKMYDEDDLTEETEEIILKRAKIGVEQAEFYLERSIESRDYALNTSIPRQHQANLDGHKNATLAYEAAMKSLPRALQLKQLEVTKAKSDAAKASKNLNDLKQDLAKLQNIHAPVDGVVYYGISDQGAWTSAAEAKKLIQGGKIVPGAQLMTIVGEGSLRVQTTIPEDKLAMLKPGARGYITPTADPLLRLPATLGKINYATSPFGFKASASIKTPEKSNLMPGMTGTLTFIIANRPNSITVPVTAVVREDGKSYVFVTTENTDPEKREVNIAETDGKKVAVIKGLAAAEKVLTIAP